MGSANDKYLLLIGGRRRHTFLKIGGTKNPKKEKKTTQEGETMKRKSAVRKGTCEGTGVFQTLPRGKEATNLLGLS